MCIEGMCIEVIHIQNTITFYTNHIFDEICLFLNIIIDGFYTIYNGKI